MRKLSVKCLCTGVKLLRISLRARGQTRAGVCCEYEALD